MLVFNPSLLINQVHLGSVPSWHELIFALSLAMLAYTGIETVANMAEESRDPGRQVPKAVNLVVLAVLGVYAGISVVALSALPVVHHGVGYSAALGEHFSHPGYATGWAACSRTTRCSGSSPGSACTARSCTSLSTTSACSPRRSCSSPPTPGMIGISRLSWSLAEHRQLPSLFSQLHPKFRTPWFTLMFFSALAGVLILYGNTNVLGNLYSFGAMLSFTTAHAAVIALRIKDPDRERPYRMPWSVRIRGAEIPMTAVVGGLGTAAAWVAVVVFHSEARVVGIPWMIVGMAGYFYYRHRQGLDPRKHYRIERAERPADFEELEYRTALVPIFGEDVSATALSSAAKLIGKEGVVYAIFVLPVPSQLSLEAGLEDEEAQGRSVLESARIQARRAGIKIHTGLIRTRNPGAALVEEAQRVGCGRDLLVHDPRPRRRAADRPNRGLPAQQAPLPGHHRDREPPHARTHPGAGGGGGLAERGAQRLIQLGVAEVVAEHEWLGGHHARAGGDDPGHLAVEQSQGDAGHRQPRGPVQRTTEGAGEVAIGNWFGRGAVDRPRPALVL